MHVLETVNWSVMLFLFPPPPPFPRPRKILDKGEEEGKKSSVFLETKRPSHGGNELKGKGSNHSRRHGLFHFRSSRCVELDNFVSTCKLFLFIKKICYIKMFQVNSRKSPKWGGVGWGGMEG